MAHYNHATLFNAHTRAYSSACELETGPPIKGVCYSFARRRKEEGPRGHLGRDEGIIRHFLSHSSAGSVEGKMCMRRALGLGLETSGISSSKSEI